MNASKKKNRLAALGKSAVMVVAAFAAPGCAESRTLDVDASAGCPSSQPVSRSACPQHGLECRFQDTCFTQTREVIATCQGDGWLVQEWTCNPPYYPPDAGADADVREAGIPDGGPPDAGACPGVRPVQDTACDTDEQCVYEYCYERPSVIASCHDGRWLILESTCNPPPPPFDGGAQE